MYLSHLSNLIVHLSYYHEGAVLNFIDVFDRQYADCSDEEYKMREIPKPFEFEVNLI